MLTRLSQSPTNDSDEPTDELTPGCGTHCLQLRREAHVHSCQLAVLATWYWLFFSKKTKQNKHHFLIHKHTFLAGTRLHALSLGWKIIIWEWISYGAKISSCLQIHTTEQDRFSCDTVLRGDERIRNWRAVRGEGVGGAGGQSRICVGTIRWQSCRERRRLLLFPLCATRRRGKTCTDKRGGFKASALDGACEWMLIKQSGGNMLWHLSAFCARKSNRRHKNKTTGRESPAAVNRALFPLFPLNLHVPFEIARRNAVHVCD